MTARAAALLGATLSMALLPLACTEPATPSKVDARPRRADVRSNAPPAKTPAELAAVTREVVVGPTPDASLDQRRAAVLALLTDGSSAEHLSLDVVDFGDDWELQRPRVQHGKPTLTRDGTNENVLEIDLVRRVVRAHTPELRDCYAKQLAVTPGVGGRLRLDWTLDGSGTVKAATVVDSSFDGGADGLGPCLLAAIVDWSFPAPASGPVHVRYPLDFVADDGP